MQGKQSAEIRHRDFKVQVGGLHQLLNLKLSIFRYMANWLRTSESSI